MNWKLFSGLFFVIMSLVIGKITTILFIIYLGNKMVFYLSLIAYLLSWVLLVIGVYVCGVEGAEYVRIISQYFSYKYYHEHIKSQIHKRRKNLKAIFRRKE